MPGLSSSQSVHSHLPNWSFLDSAVTHSSAHRRVSKLVRSQRWSIDSFFFFKDMMVENRHLLKNANGCVVQQRGPVQQGLL